MPLPCRGSDRVGAAIGVLEIVRGDADADDTLLVVWCCCCCAPTSDQIKRHRNNIARWKTSLFPLVLCLLGRRRSPRVSVSGAWCGFVGDMM